MGIRADKRKRREELAKANEKVLPNGKTYLPPNVIYKHCIGCENHVEIQVSYRQWRDLYQSKCALKSRRPYEIERDPCTAVEDIIKGSPDIKESCPCVAFMMLDADVMGMYN